MTEFEREEMKRDLQGRKIPKWAWDAGFDWGWHWDDDYNAIGGLRHMATLWITEKGKEMPGGRYTLVNEIRDTLEVKTFLETNDAADVLEFLANPPAEWIAWEAANEIMDDSKESGGVEFSLDDIKCFEDLHDHVDANGYGGAFEDDAPGWTPDGCDCEYWGEVQERVDQWIRNGFWFAHKVTGDEKLSTAEMEILEGEVKK